MVGIDEVGRGCLAGPLLVVAAKALTRLPAGLDDSKALTKAKRQKLVPLLRETCQFGEGWVGVSEINSLGLAAAMRLAVSRALLNINAIESEHIILDGKINYCPSKFINVKTLIKADSIIPIVSAASVYAKVKRDQYMKELAILNQNYGFERNVGYGTKAHLDALKIFGPIEGVHRINFWPVKILKVSM